MASYLATSYMVRTFDHAGYYETRLVLALAAIAFSVYFALRKQDRSFGLMFVCGVILQGLMEYSLLLLRLRGEGYSLSVFGLRLDGIAACVFQGVAEGGLLCVMSYWWLDLFHRPDQRRQRIVGYVWMCGLIVVAAVLVGWLARGEAITSPRPMFSDGAPVILVFQTILMLSIVWLKGGNSFHYLGVYFAGCMIYVLLTFEPMHLLGARYIAERSSTGEFSAATGAKQYVFMLYSHLFEVAGAKIHYFIIPYALGWLRLSGASRKPGMSNVI